MYGVYIRKKCKTLQAKRIVFIIHLSKGGVIYDGKEKKKSELISYILEKTGCKPEETVYIGDTWSDVIAARENNIDCIGVTYGDGDTGELLAENPRFCVDSVCELKKILEEGA